MSASAVDASRALRVTRAALRMFADQNDSFDLNLIRIDAQARRHGRPSGAQPIVVSSRPKLLHTASFAEKQSTFRLRPEARTSSAIYILGKGANRLAGLQLGEMPHPQLQSLLLLNHIVVPVVVTILNATQPM